MSDEEVEGKFVLCESGPKGGDVQIAQAALQGLCGRIIFFTDPMATHPHEPDINFFQQVRLSAVGLTTNLLFLIRLLNLLRNAVLIWQPMLNLLNTCYLCECNLNSESSILLGRVCIYRFLTL